MQSPLLQLEKALELWPQWDCALESKPTVRATLSAGRNHCNFLVESEQKFFVVRIESPESRALAMTQTQEYQLLRQLAPLSPKLIWADEQFLVTQYIQGKHWSAPSQLSALVAQLQKLHQTHIDLPPFNLLEHCDRYWNRFSSNEKKEHYDFFRTQRDHLEATLTQNPEQCLCHNDLFPENILQNEKEFTLIDWEYAGYNSPYFDLASLVEFGPLNKSQTRELLRLYWQSDDKKHIVNLKNFQQVVRFIEWLWESLKHSNKAPQLKADLKTQF